MTRFCIHYNCGKRSNFGYINKSALYCNDHKLNSMINLNRKKCMFNNCNITASFGFSHHNRVLCCFKHKLISMVNLIKRKCAVEKCKIVPIYGFKELPRYKYCYKHKTDQMVDLVHKNKKMKL